MLQAACRCESISGWCNDKMCFKCKWLKNQSISKQNTVLWMQHRVLIGRLDVFFSVYQGPTSQGQIGFVFRQNKIQE